jgi:hypothetical protein
MKQTKEVESLAHASWRALVGHWNFFASRSIKKVQEIRKNDPTRAMEEFHPSESRRFFANPCRPVSFYPHLIQASPCVVVLLLGGGGLEVPLSSQRYLGLVQKLFHRRNRCGEKQNVLLRLSLRV